MKRVRVYHRLYGCDTGCCGHAIEITNEDGKIIEERFALLNHPDDSVRGDKEAILEYAKVIIKNEVRAEHIKDLDWEHAEIDVCTDSECPENK